MASFRSRAPRGITIPSTDDMPLQIIPLVSPDHQLASRARSMSAGSEHPSTSALLSSASLSPRPSASCASSALNTSHVAEGDLHCCLEELLALAASDEVRGSAAKRLPALVEELTRDVSELREDRVSAEWLLEASPNQWPAEGAGVHAAASPFSCAAAADDLQYAGGRSAPPNRGQSALILCAGLAVAVASGAAVHGAREASSLAHELRLSRDECRQLRSQLGYSSPASASHAAAARPEREREPCAHAEEHKAGRREGGAKAGALDAAADGGGEEQQAARSRAAPHAGAPRPPRGGDGFVADVSQAPGGPLGAARGGVHLPALGLVLAAWHENATARDGAGGVAATSARGGARGAEGAPGAAATADLRADWQAPFELLAAWLAKTYPPPPPHPACAHSHASTRPHAPAARSACLDGHARRGHSAACALKARAHALTPMHAAMPPMLAYRG